VEAYRALALQARCRSVAGAADRAEARSVIKASIERLREHVIASIRFIGPDCRLVVLPEYILTGHAVGEPPEVWADKAALEQDGPEHAEMASIAREAGVFLSFNAYELDPNFPGLFFQCSFVYDPSGALVLRHRRLNSAFTPTPYDVWDRFLELYGIDEVFPVARTEIGALACIASDEILFPELARALAVRGAEVFCHSTSEAAVVDRPKQIARRARALENLAYVVSANTAGIEGSPIPGGSTDGGSQVVDHEGRVLVEAGSGESMVASAEIDLTALRRARRRPGMTNQLARNRLRAYASTYADAPTQDPNGLAAAPPDRTYFLEQQRALIQRLDREGLI
jgi:predicted amidohydrolase